LPILSAAKPFRTEIHTEAKNEIERIRLEGESTLERLKNQNNELIEGEKGRALGNF
jgi:hypothetical protein